MRMAVVTGSCRKIAAMATLLGGTRYWNAEAAAALRCFKP